MVLFENNFKKKKTKNKNGNCFMSLIEVISNIMQIFISNLFKTDLYVEKKNNNKNWNLNKRK